MATGMKLWTALVVIGVALVTIWKVPPSAVEIRERTMPLQEEARHINLLQDLRDAQATLMRIRWADSLSGLIADSEVTDAALFFTPEGHDSEDLATIAGHVQAKYDDATVGGAHARFAYVIQSRAHGLMPGSRTDERARTETYVGEVDGQPYCMRVDVNGNLDLHVRNEAQRVRRWQRTMEDDRPEYYYPGPEVLGACRMYLKYGAPGSAMLQWLENGATAFAVRDDEDDYFTLRTDYDYGVLFGLGRQIYGNTVDMERCRSGQVDVCTDLLLNPANGVDASRQDLEIARRSPALSIRDPFTGFSARGIYLMSRLEAEYGEEAFAAFWRAEGSIEDAFENELGTTAGEYAMKWIGAEYGLVPGGPLVAQTGKFGAILVILLAGGYGAFRHQLRRVA